MIYSPLLTFLFGAHDFGWENFEDSIKVGDDSPLSDVQSTMDRYKPEDARMKRSTKIAAYASIVRLFDRPPDRAGWVLNGVAGSCAGLHHRVPHAALRDALRLQQAIFQVVDRLDVCVGGRGCRRRHDGASVARAEDAVARGEEHSVWRTPAFVPYR